MTATERLRAMLDERGVEYTTQGEETFFIVDRTKYCSVWAINGRDLCASAAYITPEQAIAATLGFPKAKAHPYGYEPDTGAFDATRCECGCVNDISATYCNDCGGEIEIDMNAEKEIYHCPRHLVFVEKHDDGSLEFCGERYITATFGHSLNNQSMSESLSERGTCHIEAHFGEYYCTGCGDMVGTHDPDSELCVDGNYVSMWNYCPNCGRRVEE